MNTKILLVAEEGEARSAYTGVLSKLGVEYDCIASPDEMTDTLINGVYNGLLVDVPTMIRCECEDKNRITRIMERFPVLRLMYNSRFGGIRGLAHGGTMRDNRSLSEFIQDECIPFTPRSIRVAERHDLVFNVLLLKDIDMEEMQAERTVTINVSEHGCFVYSVDQWEAASPAWLVVNEFEDKTPIELKVRWCSHWGKAMRLPGIGASFESMTTHQYVQLHSYL
ncbi:PilZ domain-containing protein [Pseudodesulfovibrio cashew]|uniref:PilZ domain-containing protein n=1 Tax=Pseudodesulfovibrio cashew TaxID=2678688 RepID=UPI001F55A375|nr:PilZ domain-containing protein [Pseudodesulfovibrio cashew]